MPTRTIKMSDAVTAKLLDLAKRAHGTVQVGFIDSDQAPIAFWNEFGHKGRFPAPPMPIKSRKFSHNHKNFSNLLTFASNYPPKNGEGCFISLIKSFHSLVIIKSINYRD